MIKLRGFFYRKNKGCQIRLEKNIRIFGKVFNYNIKHLLLNMPTFLILLIVKDTHHIAYIG